MTDRSSLCHIAWGHRFDCRRNLDPSKAPRCSDKVRFHRLRGTSTVSVAPSPLSLPLLARKHRGKFTFGYLRARKPASPRQFLPDQRGAHIQRWGVIRPPPLELLILARDWL